MSGTIANAPSPGLVFYKTWAAALEEGLQSWKNLRPDEKTTHNFYDIVAKALDYQNPPHHVKITRTTFDQAVFQHLRAPKGKRKRQNTDDHDEQAYYAERIKSRGTRGSFQPTEFQRYDREEFDTWVEAWKKLRDLIEAHPALKDVAPWARLSDVIQRAEEAERKQAQGPATQAGGTVPSSTAAIVPTSTTATDPVQNENVPVCEPSKEVALVDERKAADEWTQPGQPRSNWQPSGRSIEADSQISLVQGIFSSLLQLSVHVGMAPKRAGLVQQYLLRRLENPRQYLPETPPPRLFRRPDSLPPLHSLSTGGGKSDVAGLVLSVIHVPAIDTVRQEEEKNLWTKIVAASSLSDNPATGQSEVGLSKQFFLEKATGLWTVLWGLCEHSWPTHKRFPSWPIFNRQKATADFIRGLHEDFLVPTCKTLYTLQKFGSTLEDFGMAFRPALWRLDILLQIRQLLFRARAKVLVDGFTKGNLTIMLDYVIDMLLKIESVYPGMHNWQKEHDWTLPSDPLWLGSGRGPYVASTAPALAALTAKEDKEIYNNVGTKVCPAWARQAYTYPYVWPEDLEAHREHGDITNGDCCEDSCVILVNALDEYRVLERNGKCEEKDAGTCPFLHPDLRTTNLCKYWMENTCRKDNCEYFHDDPNPEFRRGKKATQPCRNVMFGKVCPFGESCRFDHDKDVCAEAKEAIRKSKGPCRDYPNCFRGAGCLFLHSVPDIVKQPSKNQTAAAPKTAAPLAAAMASTPVAKKRPAPCSEEDSAKRQKQEVEGTAMLAAPTRIPTQTPGSNGNFQLPPSGSVDPFSFGQQGFGLQGFGQGFGQQAFGQHGFRQQSFGPMSQNNSFNFYGQYFPGAYGYVQGAAQLMQQPGCMTPYMSAYSMPSTQYSSSFRPQVPYSTPITAPSPYLQQSRATNSAYASGMHGYGPFHANSRPNVPRFNSAQIHGTPPPAPRSVSGQSGAQAMTLVPGPRHAQPPSQVQATPPRDPLVDRKGSENIQQNVRPKRAAEDEIASREPKRRQTDVVDKENQRSEPRTKSHRQHLQACQPPPQRKRQASDELDSEPKSPKRSRTDVVQKGRGFQNQPRNPPADDPNPPNPRVSGISPEEALKRQKRAERFGRPLAR